MAKINADFIKVTRGIQSTKMKAVEGDGAAWLMLKENIML
jgi:hypothetical protein